MSHAEELDLDLPNGRLHGERRGPADAALLLAVHGLSANLRGFDFIGERLAGPERQIVALDMRGRGRSEITPPGTYGLDAHARDAIEAATRLGAERFDYVGWSMGALIGIQVAQLAPERLRSLILVDHAGQVDDIALELVRKGLDRLDAVVPAPEPYLDAIRAAGTIDPWSEYWDRFYRYELGPHDGGLKPTTSKAASLEDFEELQQHDWSALWAGLTMPTLLLRCTVPLGGGYVVPESERDGIKRAAADLRVVEIDRNHFTVMTDEQTVAAIRDFLAAQR